MSARIDEIIADLIERRAAGEHISDEQAIAMNPDLMPELAEALASLRKVIEAKPPAGPATHTRPDQAGQPLRDTPTQAGCALKSAAIPGYEITKLLSRGGQGAVYQAVQTSTKRKVAIKVLLDGEFASDRARRRFEREVELVAQLKHPNIISIFDSGHTAEGRQYAVMDYVRGVRLNQYVRDNKLTLEDALQLFNKVLDAVQYAHQKGVIHRDLKPSNILVDSEGNPKVLDFGLAKQVLGTTDSVLTMTEQVVGTLQYMSPEQTTGNPDLIDTRTDVYALGVILYEMITGTFPYPVLVQMTDLIKHITEMEPTPPTRAWSADSGIALRSRRPKLRPGECPIDDELQTIALKLLRKDRERRYQSAGELQADIARYLAGEPIEAKRDSGWYVLKKTLHRYRTAIAVVVGLGAVLLLATATSTVFFWRAEEQRQLAERRLNELELIAQFHETQLTAIDGQALGNTLRNGLRERIAALATKRGLQGPQTEALGQQYDRLVAGADFTGLAVDALDKHIFEQAIDAIRSDFADNPKLHNRLLFPLGYRLFELGLLDKARATLNDSLTMCRQLYGDEHPFTMKAIDINGRVLLRQQDVDAAEPLIREALLLRRRVLGSDHPDTAKSASSMGLLLQAKGDLDGAESYFREALDKSRALDEAHYRIAVWHMGTILLKKRDLDAAEPLLREALETSRRAFGEHAPETIGRLENLGTLLQWKGNFSEAETCFRQALSLARETFGDIDLRTLASIHNTGLVLYVQDRLDAAEPFYRERLATQRLIFGDKDPIALQTALELASILAKQGKLSAAEPLFLEVAEGRRLTLGNEHERTQLAVGCLVDLYEAMHKAAPDAGYNLRATTWRAQLTTGVENK